MAEKPKYKGQLPNEQSKCYCPTCKRTIQAKAFYTYPDGSKAKMCKKCLTMHVMSYEPETYMWIIKEFDAPYIEQVWNTILEKEAKKNPKTVNGPKVIGKYLAQMKLNQWKMYHWEDTEKLKEEQEAKEQAFLEQTHFEEEKSEEILQEKLASGEISEAEYKTLTYEPTPPAPPEIEPSTEEEVVEEIHAQPLFEPAIDLEKIPDPSKELDEESLIYLVAKWGETYSAKELFSLEKDYMGMMNSFDIQDKDTENTLKLICKLNLKTNQAVDEGDVDAMQRFARVLDPLRKSAKFTAAQNKVEESEFIDSIGELVDFCERNGGRIPPHDISTTEDKIDVIIKDLKEWNKTLIHEDKSLARMIEDHIRKKEQIMEQKAKKELEPLDDDDYVDFLDKEEEMLAADARVAEGDEE